MVTVKKVASFLGIMLFVSCVYGQDGWVGSGSSGSKIGGNSADISLKGKANTNTHDLGTTALNFPASANVKRASHDPTVLYYVYDGLQVISSKPVGYNVMLEVVKMYSGASVAEGSFGEWQYKWSNTGHGIVYAAKHKTLENLYMSGIVDEGVIRDEDAYVKVTLNNVRATVPTTMPVQ